MNRKAFLYGLSAMSCSMLHCIFVSFYIDYFVRENIMKSPSAPHTHDSTPPLAPTSTANLNWFIIGQVVYAAWNALNDLGFGWLSDTAYVRTKARMAATVSTSLLGRAVPHWLASTRSVLSRRRLSRVAVGGPLWAAAFAFLWYPTPLLRDISPALELSIKMIIYDGFFSYTTVSFRALLVDITTDVQQRELCNVYASVFHVIGSVGVMFASLLFEAAHHTRGHNIPKDAEATSGRDLASASLVVTEANLSSFRTFCLLWAMAAAVGFILSSTAAGNSEVTLKYSNAAQLEHENGSDSEKKDQHTIPSIKSNKETSFTSFVSQTIRRPGMVTVLIVWFLQDYSCTFATNFFSLFLTLVAGPHITPFSRSVLLLISFVVPHAITIAATPFIPTLGKKFLVSLYLGTRTVVGVAFLFLLSSISASAITSSKESVDATTEAPLMLTSTQIYLFATLLLLNRVLTEAVCRTQGLIISDVCDEDTIAYRRPASMAGAIHGLVNVVSRPSQSAAPVLSCIYLASYGVLMPSEDRSEDSSSATNAPLPNGSIATALPILKLLAATIIITTLVMLTVWRLWYNLDGPYLANIRLQMAMRVDNRRDTEESHGQASHLTRKDEADDGTVLMQTGHAQTTVTARKPAAKASLIV